MNIATGPLDKPITRGLYRYSRHPMYIAMALLFVGASIASASWFLLVLSVLLIITHFYNAISEERECLKVYGNAYREYMNKTPRWIGIPRYCLNCRRCLLCPQEINIPKIIQFLESMENATLPGVHSQLKKQYGKLEKTFDDCTDCKECEERCSQSFPIVERLKKAEHVLGGLS